MIGSTESGRSTPLWLVQTTLGRRILFDVPVHSYQVHQQPECAHLHSVCYAGGSGKHNDCNKKFHDRYIDRIGAMQ